MKQDPKAIVIGAGVAGLAGAIRLSVQGFDVTVYEKNKVPGGKIGRIEMDGYRFDSGPSLFTQPQLIEELFTLAGENIHDYFSYRKMPVSCRYFYEDGTRLTAHADRALFAEELSEKMGEDPQTVNSYLERSKRIYKDIGHVFLDQSLQKLKLFNARMLKALSATRVSYLFNTMHQVNRKHFRNDKTVQLFNRYATYNGSDPYRAPGMLCMIPHLEHNEGSFYPNGGMVSIAEALYQLALKKGVQFYFNAAVERIVRHDGRAMGVVVNGENKNAVVVVSNLDAYFTYRYLLKDEHIAHKISKQERSSSALIFYWGINKEFPQLDLHNIFFSKNYRAEFDHLFRRKKPFDDPTVYINITSKCEPGLHAERGKENWFVMINVPANNGQNWQNYRQQYRNAVINKLNRLLETDIEPLIEAEEIMDPVQIEANTGSFMGSIYGTSSNARMAAFVRHPNFSKRIDGLYFVGGSVHPGGGIPLCLRSAKIMSELVAAEQKKKEKHH